MGVLGQDVDDFTYWMRLSEQYGDMLTGFVEQIEGQLKEFTDNLVAYRFRCASYHVFPFDSRSISVVMGEHPNSPLSFSISLEDFRVNVGEALENVVARVYCWRGSCDDPRRYDFKAYNFAQGDFSRFDPTSIVFSNQFKINFATIVIPGGGLLRRLREIYDGVIAVRLPNP